MKRYWILMLIILCVPTMALAQSYEIVVGKSAEVAVPPEPAVPDVAEAPTPTTLPHQLEMMANMLARVASPEAIDVAVEAVSGAVETVDGAVEAIDQVAQEFEEAAQDPVEQVVVAEVPTHYIGIIPRDVPDFLRQHLKLKENEGIMIVHVAPDSPAAKAGLVRNDIIVKVGQTPVESKDFAKSIRESKDKTLKIEVIHEGDRKIVEVTPSENAPKIKIVPQPGVSDQALLEWLKKMPRGAGINGGSVEVFTVPHPQPVPPVPNPQAASSVTVPNIVPMPVQPGQPMPTVPQSPVNPSTGIPPGPRSTGRPVQKYGTAQGQFGTGGYGTGIAIAGPGVIVSRLGGDIPKGWSFSYKKEGDKPVEITVKKGDQSWTVKENEIDKLPEEIRPYFQSKFDPFIGGPVSVWTGKVGQEAFPRAVEAQKQAELRQKESNEAMMKTLQNQLKASQRQAQAFQRLAEDSAEHASSQMEELQKKFDAEQQARMEKLNKNLEEMQKKLDEMTKRLDKQQAEKDK